MGLGDILTFRGLVIPAAGTFLRPRLEAPRKKEQIVSITPKIKEAAEAAQDRLRDAVPGREDVPAPMRMVRNLGISSDIAYSLGLASVLLGLVAWFLGRTDRAHQRGIFIGLWAPTFMAIGKALEGYEPTSAGS
jgi:hypothetical protein